MLGVGPGDAFGCDERTRRMIDGRKLKVSRGVDEDDRPPTRQPVLDRTSPSERHASPVSVVGMSCCAHGAPTVRPFFSVPMCPKHHQVGSWLDHNGSGAPVLTRLT